jgi:hypothetical protein
MQEAEAVVVTLEMVELLELEEMGVGVMVVQHNKHLDNQEQQILAEAEVEEMIIVHQEVQVEKV